MKLKLVKDSVVNIKHREVHRSCYKMNEAMKLFKEA